ncbi:retrovirus-related pol polyprotein from transposon TNT 1-94 [Tanacetum coccineum]
MSNTVPPIPSPFRANTGNPSRPIRDGNPTDTINNTTTTSVKDRLLIYLDSLEPYLLGILYNGPFVPLSPLSTPTNHLPKPQNQRSHADRRLANQDKRLTKSTRFTIQASNSKALISNPSMQESGSDIEEDQRSSSEFLADLHAEFHERSLLANQRRFYKRSGRVGSIKIPIDMSNETCLAYGKLGHFQKDCPSIKTPTPPYPSASKSYNKPKFHINSTPQHNQSVNNNQKDYIVNYKGIKPEIVVLTKKIDAMNKGKSEKLLVAESFDCDEESVSSDDERVTTFKELMAIADEEISVRRVDARSEEKLAKSKYNSLKQEFSLCKSELTDLKNTKAQNSSFQNEINKLSLEIESLKDEISDLKKVIEKWTSSRVTLDQLLTEQVPGNIIRALGGKGMRKEKISSKEVIFTKSDVSSKTSPKTPSDSESEVKRTLAKLKAQPSQGSLRKVPMIPKPYVPCKYCGFIDHHSYECEYYPGCDLCGSIAYETTNCVKKTPKRIPRLALQRSTEPTAKYSKESGLKVVFGDNSSGDTEGYGLVNCNGITFTKVAYVNGLKHNLISISQLCDANFKVLFTKT